MTAYPKALTRALAEIDAYGIREARKAHDQRYALVQHYAQNPALFFAFISPSLSTSEAVADAAKFIALYRNLPQWKRESRARDIVIAKQKRVFARFFRRYGARVWLKEAA